LSRGQDYITEKGEVRQIALQDGSVVTLNTATHLTVQFSKGRRDVHLVQGEALFDVAKDVSRPFSVAAGTTLARVVGTSFTVTHLKDRPVRVLVKEGIVEVGRLGSAAMPPVTLVANTRAVDPSKSTAGEDSAPAITITSVPATELHRELAWRDGQIAFEGQTLLEAASEFARYSDTRIVVDDPSLGREEIAGLYQSNDPVGFAQAVAESLNAHAEILDGSVRISR
jgi:transmembrane sensor